MSFLSRFSTERVSSTLWSTPYQDEKTTDRSTLFILENKEMTDTIRKAYDSDDLFRDTAAYFGDADEKIPLGLL